MTLQTETTVMDRRDTQLLTISLTTRTVTMPVTTTRGATFSLAEEELNSQEKNSGAPISQISPRDVSPRRHGPPQETIWAGGLQFEPTWRPRFSHKHSISEKLSICLWNKEIQSRDTDASHQTALVISVPSVHTVS